VKVLFAAPGSIGDTIYCMLPMLPILQSRGYTVHGMFRNRHAYRLLRETPYFERVLPLCEKGLQEEISADSKKWFEDYDKVYIVNGYSNKGVTRRVVNVAYRPIMKLAEWGEEFRPEYMRLNIDWYSDFYKDFRCGLNSVLLNTTSSAKCRTYTRPLKPELEKLGFEVLEFDLNSDIRENMHLVNQVSHVLSVDTSTQWLARCLGKTPHVFMSRDSGKFSFFMSHFDFEEEVEIRCGVKNLVPWHDHMDDIEPSLIAKNFANAVKKVSFL